VLPSDKIMFEIYREAGYGRQYRAVYFTELDEHSREVEIARATAGDHFYDGFLLANDKLVDAKRVVSQFVAKLNRGEAVPPTDVARALVDYQG
jgi:hypothetical protein